MISTLLAVFSSFARLIMSDPTKERTFIAVKPDGVQRGLVGEIIKRFERRGYKLVACKMMHASKEHLGKHYSALANKPFFNDLVAYMHSGPVVAMASKDHLKKHYADLSSKPFFDGLVNYMNSGPVVAMVWEGRNVVAMGRKLLGATKPDDSAPGTIRGDFCIDVGRNICHGSDAVESAKREIDLWFEPKELVQWDSCEKSWVYE